MKKKDNQIFLIYKQTDLMTSWVIKVFKEEADAYKYCKDQNDLNQPEFDDWGYCEGVYHEYTPAKVE